VTPESKIYSRQSKCSGLAQEIGFSAPNLGTIPWLVKGTQLSVKGATQLCSSKKECNKLDMTVAQYF
jgi:hypothetical protein